jgi:hypothetical protein
MSMAFMAKFTTETTTDGQDAYAVEGGIVEQEIGSIRTVAAFGGQRREMQKYTNLVNQAYKAGIRKAISTGSVWAPSLASSSLATRCRFGTVVVRSRIEGWNLAM